MPRKKKRDNRQIINFAEEAANISGTNCPSDAMTAKEFQKQVASKANEIAACINKWSHRFPFFESACVVSTKHGTHVLWMNGSFIGPHGWSYAFTMLTVKEGSPITEGEMLGRYVRRHAADYGIEIADNDLPDLVKFATELKAIIDAGDVYVETYDSAECSFFY